MFVQINEAYAAIRRGLTRRRPEPSTRYVRKPRPRRPEREPMGRHRSSIRRPSYGHPAQRARRAFVSAFRQSGSRQSAPIRSTTAIGRAVVRYTPRTVNATVRAWLADQKHPRKSHRHPDAGHRRAHVYLPNIGWCWDTDELPKVSHS